jgi:hypothetical protein
MAESTGKRGRPAGQTNLDSLFLQWRRSTELATNPDAEIEAEVERYRAQLKDRVGLRAQLAKVDAQAALARFQIHGGKIKNGVPVNADGTPYLTTAERAEKTAETK